MECLTYCIAKQIDLYKLESVFTTKNKRKIERHWQVLEIEDLQANAVFYVFANGTVVSWHLKRHQMQTYLRQIKPMCVGPLRKPIFDGFYYTIGAKTTIQPHGYFNLDVMSLESDEPDIKLSLSYGFSQSIKLRYYEQMLDSLIEQYTPYLSRLSGTRIKTSRTRMRSILANIASVKAELNVHGRFSYLPKFFWKHPNLEEYFLMLQSYMDITLRTKALNQQLNTLNEIFYMLHSYLEENHSHNLEIIIIVLIAIEIIFNFIHLQAS